MCTVKALLQHWKENREQIPIEFINQVVRTVKTILKLFLKLWPIRSNQNVEWSILLWWADNVFVSENISNLDISLKLSSKLERSRRQYVLLGEPLLAFYKYIPITYFFAVFYTCTVEWKWYNLGKKRTNPIPTTTWKIPSNPNFPLNQPLIQHNDW